MNQNSSHIFVFLFKVVRPHISQPNLCACFLFTLANYVSCPFPNPQLEHYNGTVYIVQNIKLLINLYNYSVKYDLIHPSISIMSNCFYLRNFSKKYIVHASYFPVPLDLLKMLKARLLKLFNLNAVYGSGITRKRYKLWRSSYWNFLHLHIISFPFSLQIFWNICKHP